MSYTPDDQQIENRVGKVLSALNELQTAFKARRYDRERWNKDHLSELVTISKQMTDLEETLLNLIS